MHGMRGSCYWGGFAASSSKMVRAVKRTLGASVSVLLVAIGMVVVPTSTASASVGCSAVSVRVNSTSGGEGASDRNGHSHMTGKHYVSRITSAKMWYWSADNDNGRTDKWDTAYGFIQC